MIQTGMHRHALTDAQWKRLQEVLPRQKAGPAAMRGDRLFIEAVLYRAKTGLAWRDLPERFGPWKTVYNRFANWSRKGHWERIFRLLQYEVDEQGCIADGSIVRAHQDASGGKGGSFVTPSGVLVEVSLQNCTPSSTLEAGPCTSPSRPDSDMK